MTESEQETEAARLYEAWKQALSTVRATETDQAADDEQHAYDELVDFVEANEMNNGRWDPR